MTKSLQDLRAELARWQKHRPNHLAALDPEASEETREEWSKWCARKRELKMLIREALDEDACHWRPI